MSLFTHTHVCESPQVVIRQGALSLRVDLNKRAELFTLDGDSLYPILYKPANVNEVNSAQKTKPNFFAVLLSANKLRTTHAAATHKTHCASYASFPLFMYKHTPSSTVIHVNSCSYRQIDFSSSCPALCFFLPPVNQSTNRFHIHLDAIKIDQRSIHQLA